MRGGDAGLLGLGSAGTSLKCPCFAVYLNLNKFPDYTGKINE